MDATTSGAFSGILQMLGVMGAGCYILGYCGLQLRLWHGTQLRYILINLTAACLVLVSLIANFNLASAIVQITWICISLFGIARTSYLNSAARFTAEERALLDAKFAAMGKISARRFLNAGLWVDVDAGTPIATEGEPINALYYLADGTADVLAGGSHIGTCTTPTFIGEMTCLDGGPASASVVMASKGRLFRIGTPALHQLCQKDTDLKMILENAIGADTRLKLIAANQRLTERAAQ